MLDKKPTDPVSDNTDIGGSPGQSPLDSTGSPLPPVSKSLPSDKDDSSVAPTSPLGGDNLGGMPQSQGASLGSDQQISGEGTPSTSQVGSPPSSQQDTASPQPGMGSPPADTSIGAGTPTGSDIGTQSQGTVAGEEEKLKSGMPPSGTPSSTPPQEVPSPVTQGPTGTSVTPSEPSVPSMAKPVQPPVGEPGVQEKPEDRPPSQDDLSKPPQIPPVSKTVVPGGVQPESTTGTSPISPTIPSSETQPPESQGVGSVPGGIGGGTPSGTSPDNVGDEVKKNMNQ